MSELLAMGSEVIIDIETQNSFEEVGKYDPRLLKVSLVGVYDYRDDKLFALRENELNKLWPILEKASVIIGYNLDGFDMPVLDQYYPGDISRLPTLDLMDIVKQSYGRRPKLDELLKATFNTQKTGHGLLAIEYFKQGNWEALEKYCLDDVRLTKDLYEYGKKFRHVKCFSPYNTPEVISVNFEPPEDDNSNINLSLPF